MIKLELKKFTSIKIVADWVELNTVFNGDTTKSELDHILNNNDFPNDTEDFINSVWRELRTRNGRYSGVLPMTIDRHEVRTNLDWEQYPEYVLMLILSLEGNNWKPQVTGVLFERICKEALEEYIGGNARVVGFPEKVSVEAICQEIQEEFIQELPARYKDRKLDVVGWKKIDNRNNKLLILMQCAAGNDWRGKTAELQCEVWRDYIRFGCTPTRAFGFAHSIDDDLFFETGKEGGIIFDRSRLFLYLSSKPHESLEELRGDIHGWCNDRINELVA